MKTASQVAARWANRSQNASQDYLRGARETTKDQAAAAIAAIPSMKAGLDAAFAARLQEKGLQRSGKAGWQKGVEEKGGSNYGTGVQSDSAKTKYEENSGRYDSARGAAASIARGPKGSAGNIARVTAVVTAERKVKVGG